MTQSPEEGVLYCYIKRNIISLCSVFSSSFSDESQPTPTPPAKYKIVIEHFLFLSGVYNGTGEAMLGQ